MTNPVASAAASGKVRSQSFAFERKLALLFALLFLLLGLLFGLHWFMVLEPTLRVETESRARVLAQAQAQAIEYLLNGSVQAEALRHELETALDAILLLTDGSTERPFVQRIVLALDYELTDAPHGSLDLARGQAYCGDCIVTQVPLYRPADHVLAGIATFHASPQFLHELIVKVRIRLAWGSGLILGLIGLAWFGVRRLLRRLAEREADLRGLFEVAPFPIMLHEDGQPGLRLANAAAKRYLELRPDDRGQLEGPLWDQFQAVGLTARDDAPREVRIALADGQVRWALASLRRLRLSDLSGVLISLVDVSEIKAVQDELHLASMTDGLTGLYNRRYLFQRLAREVEQAQALIQAQSRSSGENRHAFSLILFDLDHFKSINDRFGHQVGDLVLIKVAAALRTCLREEDVAGRHGGEEFMVILPGCGLAEAMLAAERIRAMIAAMNWAQTGLRVTISGGVREYAGTGIDTLIEEADANLYRAKHAGRDRVIG